jgi:hypothetical protein
MSLPWRAAWAARFSGFFSSQVQLSGNSPAEAGSMPQMSEPKAIRSIFFVLMLHGLSQPALADNAESFRQAEELKPVRIRVICVMRDRPHLLGIFEQSHNRSSKTARDNRVQEE